MDVRQYLSYKGFNWTEVQRPKGKNAIMNCPFCGDTEKKFAIQLETGAFNCFHRNKCGLSGSFRQLQRMLGDLPRSLDNDKAFITKKNKVFSRPIVKSQKLSGNTTQFLHQRKISDDTIIKFKIGQTHDGKAIMIPYFKDGQLVNIKYRKIDEKKFWQEKDTEPILFNRDNCVSGESLYIVEGEFDAIALSQYGIDAVSVPMGVSDTTWIEHEWDWLQQFKTIYLIFDNDKAGQENVINIANRLGRWRCHNVLLPEKDINDCLIKGIDTETVIECIKNAQEFILSNLVSASYFESDILELFRDPQKINGLTTGFIGLDNILKGWRLEELTLWSGSNGSGKSTFLNEVIINLARNKIRSCIASLEMPPSRYLRWAICQVAKSEKPKYEEIKEILHFLDEYLYIINAREEIDSVELINYFEYAARKYGVKHFFIDSLMRVSFPMKDEIKEHTKFCNDLLAFAKDHQVHIHLVAHPRKGTKDTDTPGKVDISGTSNLTNLAHNVLVLWRPDDKLKDQAKEKGKEMADNYLFVKKNREWGMEGKIMFSFDAKTKNFNEIHRM